MRRFLIFLSWLVMRVLYVVQLSWVLYDKAQRRRYVLYRSSWFSIRPQGHIAKLVTSPWTILDLAGGRDADSHIFVQWSEEN